MLIASWTDLRVSSPMMKKVILEVRESGTAGKTVVIHGLMTLKFPPWQRPQSNHVRFKFRQERPCKDSFLALLRLIAASILVQISTSHFSESGSLLEVMTGRRRFRAVQTIGFSH